MRRVWRWCVLSVGMQVSLAHAELDLRPLEAGQWNPATAAHLLSRAGFGISNAQARAMSQQSMEEVVDALLNPAHPQSAFVHSDIFEPGLDPFPPSRPATTALARQQGHALGVAVRPEGNRPMQGVVNKFFYWLRASRLETDRVAYWWAERMLLSESPLQEKLALFWHGHFACNEDKVRDYRKMLRQVELFRSKGLGSFRDLVLAVAQDPAMLVFLDAGVNTKDSPNENFAREIMELFTMGVGHYGERDVQEAARAFTGWNVEGLEFTLVSDDHDTARKSFLGEEGNFSGAEIIDIIMRQPVTADFIAAKLYRYFVNEDLSRDNEAQLGAVLRQHDYHIGQYLGVLFRSRDFYSQANTGSRIKGPVELVVSTYRRLGLDFVPGVPDFNVTTAALGQRLLHPPTVAGWSEGRSWITPSLLFERGNFALDVLFPDIGFVPPDRYPVYTAEVVNVQDRLRQGMSISEATRPSGVAAENTMAASNLLADRDEDFNTRLGSMRGWQMAIERVLPISRKPARLNLTREVANAALRTPREVVEHYLQRFFLVRPDEAVVQAMTAFLREELGTEDVGEALTFAEEPLRKLLHQLLSLPEYQLG